VSAEVFWKSDAFCEAVEATGKTERSGEGNQAGADMMLGSHLRTPLSLMAPQDPLPTALSQVFSSQAAFWHCTIMDTELESLTVTYNHECPHPKHIIILDYL
jgi:hypothetical protein